MKHWREFRSQKALALSGAVVALLLLCAGVALGRAGGGEHYSGGGGSGGGGGGGDGGGAELVFWLIQLCIAYPQVGVPLLIAVVVFFVYAQRRGTAMYQGSVIRRGNIAGDAGRRQASLAALRAEDPQFDPGRFVQQVRDGFVRVQAAWGRQDLSPVRPFVSDGVFERFSLQFAEQKAFGYRNAMDGVTVTGAAIVAADLDEVYQQIAVRIEAVAADYEVAVADGRVVGGDKATRPLAEVWSFLRRRGVKTVPGRPGLIEGNCPNCGAAIEMNQNANCAHCGAVLRSGMYDWVLSEITQTSEWAGRGSAALPGGAEMRGRDPGFNVQAMEDQASVIFWRKMQAERVGKVDPLRRMSTAGFASDYAAALTEGRVGMVGGDGSAAGDGTEDRGQRLTVDASDPQESAGISQSVNCQALTPDGLSARVFGDAGQMVGTGLNPRGGRTFYARCGVGAVDVLGVVLGTEVDRALVRVMWSATRYRVGADRRVTNEGQTAVSSLLMVLARDAAANTKLDAAVSSAHCPKCGGPEMGGATAACEFCGAVLNDGKGNWLLMACMPTVSEEGMRMMSLLRRVVRRGKKPRMYIRGSGASPHLPGNGDRPEHPAPSALLAWMIQTAVADGKIADREKALLRGLAMKRGIAEERLDAMIAAAANGGIDLPPPANAEEARAWVAAMGQMAMADGRVDAAEMKLIRTAGASCGLSEWDVTQVIRQTRGRMYDAAREQLRGRKKARV